MIEDYIYKYKNLYRKSPNWFKSIFGGAYSIIPLRYRFGKDYVKYKNLLEESQWWARDELRDWQLSELKKLLKHAYNNVPYYNRVFKERNLKPEDINSISELAQLPYLTKKLVRDNFEDLTATNYPESKKQFFNTGGSTGTPLEFYWEKGRTRPRELAFMYRQWGWVDCFPEKRERSVVLKGYHVNNILGDYDPIENSLFLSSFKMKEEIIKKYIERIREFRPKSIQAYPSVITLLAQYMLNNNEDPIDSIKVILCGSENIYIQQRKLIEKAFQCRVFSWYGQSECVSLAGNCEYSNNYHIYTEYGVTEVVDKNGNIISEDEEGKGEIIATGFNNYLMPFIRYKTGDIGKRIPTKCECGRDYPLLERIEGRDQEYVIRKDGGVVPLTSLIFALHFSAFQKIEKLQISQEKEGIIEIKIIKTKNYTKIDEKEIKNKILKSVNGTLEITFTYVEEIKRTESGKHKFLIQKLPIPCL